jgi:hypothetical protein
MSGPRCAGCYRSDFDGSWWCDNCDQWPCICGPQRSTADVKATPLQAFDTGKETRDG